jgi:hypothetical protein
MEDALLLNCISGTYSGEKPDVGSSESQIMTLEDILLGVERTDPDEFTDLESLRAALVEIGETATSDPPTFLADEATIRGDAEERALFCSHISGLTLDDLRRVRPLPYRRVLSENTAHELWRRVVAKWGPLPPDYGAERPEETEWFYGADFYQAVPPSEIRRVLRDHALKRVWKLNGDNAGDQYEMDVAMLSSWCWLDCCWTAGSMDWILFRSHEFIITIGGRWLLEAVARAWPEWREGIYDGGLPYR